MRIKREGRATLRGPSVWNLSLPVADGAIKIADAALRISRVAVRATPAEFPASTPTSTVPATAIIPAILLADPAGGRSGRQPAFCFFGNCGGLEYPESSVRSRASISARQHRDYRDLRANSVARCGRRTPSGR